jgi:gamma-glutamyl-gamma-aminobutyrate hydrolase PuuD
MEATQAKRAVRIGVLTQPVSDKIDPKDLTPPDQYILDPLKSFLEHSGDGVVVALRYNLIDEPDILRKTLDSLDGILFTGGFLSIRYYHEMPPAALTYTNTAAFILKYVMETKIPLLGIC